MYIWWSGKIEFSPGVFTVLVSVDTFLLFTLCNLRPTSFLGTSPLWVKVIRSGYLRVGRNPVDHSALTCPVLQMQPRGSPVHRGQTHTAYKAGGCESLSDFRGDFGVPPLLRPA